jgi:hypothetical protein
VHRLRLLQNLHFHRVHPQSLHCPLLFTACCPSSTTVAVSSRSVCSSATTGSLGSSPPSRSTHCSSSSPRSRYLVFHTVVMDAGQAHEHEQYVASQAPPYAREEQLTGLSSLPQSDKPPPNTVRRSSTAIPYLPQRPGDDSHRTDTASVRPLPPGDHVGEWHGAVPPTGTRQTGDKPAHPRRTSVITPSQASVVCTERHPEPGRISHGQRGARASQCPAGGSLTLGEGEDAREPRRTSRTPPRLR